MVFTCGKLNLYVAFFQVKTTMVFNHQWICKQWKCWDDVYGALMFFSKISSGRTIFLKGWLCIWMPVFQVIWSSAFIYRLTRWEALYKGKFGYEYRYDSAGGISCFTNSKLSLFSTYLTSSILLPIQIFLLFKCSLFFSNYCELYFSFSCNILKSCSAAQFSREQKHTVEISFFLYDCISYH